MLSQSSNFSVNGSNLTNIGGHNFHLDITVVNDPEVLGRHRPDSHCLEGHGKAGACRHCKPSTAFRPTNLENSDGIRVSGSKIEVRVPGIGSRHGGTTPTDQTENDPRIASDEKASASLPIHPTSRKHVNLLPDSMPDSELIPLDDEYVDVLYPTSTRSRPSGPATYGRLMLGENGLPMWMPKPTSLPEDRIAEGIVPGDVGLLTEDGTSFHYLFNIWRDRQTLEEAHVPGGRDFLPAPERVLQAPAEEFLTGMGTILEGAAEERVYMSDSPPPHCNLHYGWCEEEGAVLVTPFGAHVDSLADRTVLEPFIKHNCRRLYQVAKNKGGIRTAPLYIVTGCVKTSSWAMAAYRTSKKRPTAAGATMAPVAKLQNVLKSQESERTSFGYQWTSKSNGTSAHSGPNFCSSASDDRNQCLFIRGYRLSAFLDDEASSGQCITVASDEKGSNPAHYGSVSSLKGAESASGLFRSTATSNKESFQLDAMPQQRSLNPGECINGFMSSPEANRIINQVNRNFAHPPILADASEDDQITRFALGHDDLWTANWKLSRAKGPSCFDPDSSSSRWDATLLESLKRTRKETAIILDSKYSDIVSVEKKRDSALLHTEIALDWREFFSQHQCSHIDHCLYRLAHLATVSEDPIDEQNDSKFLSQLLNGDTRHRLNPQQFIRSLTPAELETMLRISTFHSSLHPFSASHPATCVRLAPFVRREIRRREGLLWAPETQGGSLRLNDRDRPIASNMGEESTQESLPFGIQIAEQYYVSLKRGLTSVSSTPSPPQRQHIPRPADMYKYGEATASPTPSKRRRREQDQVLYYQPDQNPLLALDLSSSTCLTSVEEGESRQGDGVPGPARHLVMDGPKANTTSQSPSSALWATFGPPLPPDRPSEEMNQESL